MKQVIMRYVAETLLPLSKEEVTSFNAGGYSFCIDKKYICFDFDAFCIHTEQLPDGRLRIEYKSGHGLLFNDFDISHDYDQEYEDLGLSYDTITASFLASASSIKEFVLNFYTGDEDILAEEMGFKVTSIEFENENKETFTVKQEALYTETI